MTELTEAQISCSIVSGILTGDSTAESQMIDRYGKGLFTVLRVNAKSSEIAQEIVQETWRIVLEKVRANEINDPSKLAAFITQVGKNQLLMYFRKSKRHTFVDLAELPMEKLDSVGPEGESEAADLARCVKSVLTSMRNKRDQEVILRFYLKEEDKTVICEALDLTPTHFDRVLYRAKQRFKAVWQEQQVML